MFGKMVDVPLADQFIKRNGIGVLRIPFGREKREQYLSVWKAKEVSGLKLIASPYTTPLPLLSFVVENCHYLPSAPKKILQIYPTINVVCRTYAHHSRWFIIRIVIVTKGETNVKNIPIINNYFIFIWNFIPTLNPDHRGRGSIF